MPECCTVEYKQLTMCTPSVHYCSAWPKIECYTHTSYDVEAFGPTLVVLVSVNNDMIYALCSDQNAVNSGHYVLPAPPKDRTCTSREPKTTINSGSTHTMLRQKLATTFCLQLHRKGHALARANKQTIY